MIKIEKRKYGYHVAFSGIVTAEETIRTLEESRNLLKEGPGSFGVLVDLREVKPMSHPAMQQFLNGRMLFKRYGMVRSAIIVSNPIVRRQFMDMAKNSALLDWERYLDISNIKNWEQVALDWIIEGVDPDKKESKISNVE